MSKSSEVNRNSFPTPLPEPRHQDGNSRQRLQKVWKRRWGFCLTVAHESSLWMTSLIFSRNLQTIVPIAALWIASLVFVVFFNLQIEIFWIMSFFMILFCINLIFDIFRAFTVNARERFHAIREHTGEDASERRSHTTHKRVDRMEKHLRHGDPYHFGSDGEIIFDKKSHGD